LDEIGTEAKLDEIEGQKWKCALRYTDFLVFPLSNKQKVRVLEYTFSLLHLNLVQFGFCTNLVQFRFSSLIKLFAQSGGPPCLHYVSTPPASEYSAPRRGLTGRGSSGGDGSRGRWLGAWEPRRLRLGREPRARGLQRCSGRSRRGDPHSHRVEG